MRKYVVAMTLIVAALSFAAAVVFAQGGVEAGVAAQWKTAVQHSKFSQDYNGLKEVQSHLQHTVNCLEGAGGPGFEGGAGNPCQGQGNGMIVDAKKAGGKYASAAAWMETADTLAKTGLKQKTPEASKAFGQATQVVLEQIGKGIDLK